MRAALHLLKPIVGCAAHGCDRDAENAGFCHKHYVKKLRTGIAEDRIHPVRLSTMVPLGVNITALRYAAEMSLETLAVKAGLSTWSISRVTRGESCSLLSLQAIASALNVEAWRLLKPDEFELPQSFRGLCY